ncbi:HD domain-containing phosphohydrolase [Anaeromyxobacter sp. Fw109-5]|uniref:HD domain-containing phosphohydrolase n=1 Tax=Anaeromyxobacter sp. (strain Fw109-5) TaxID=404589 RepID=UPI0000ED6E7E|nr:HD domain-containing phosphohydrolase [Anaeromyxobacter sp. Fw109-5]ABS27985.1 metal dependent phosphohydrolase [Anaeromyxobacter sp. Fw109-5]
MFDRLTLTEDLLDCRGAIVARRGTVISPEAIAEVAQGAPGAHRQRLAETALERDVLAPLTDATYRHLFHGDSAREAVQRVIESAMLPDVLVEELVHARREQPALHAHAFATAAVAVRMLLLVVGPARGLPDLAAAALLHDLGMRHLPRKLREPPERLPREDALRIAAHPLTGAYHLARVLGAHPAVAAARSHHWRCGQGYPALGAPPSRSIEVVSVASAFAALTQPRAFRSAAYSARGAADVLVADAAAGHADTTTVRLLVHALRGGRGDPRAVKFGHGREGHAPEVNRYAPVEAPPRAYV